MEPRRILIVHSGAIGDFILALPAIGALRRRFGSAYIELLGNPSIHAIAEKRYYLDKVTSMGARAIHRLFAGELPVDLYEYLSRFDLIVSWFGRMDENYTRTLGLVRGRKIIERPFPPEGSRMHAADYLLSTLAPLGIDAADNTPRLYLSAQDRESASRILKGLGLEGRAVAALHPGSGSPRKCWPAERFAELARTLLERDMEVLIIEGPADAQPVEKALSLAGSEQGKRPARLSNFSLLDLAAVLERCSFYVGNDSGITHIAAAVGTPAVAIFCVTDPAVWGPRGRVAILENLPSVEEVLRAVDEIRSR